jgi:hypothetical protein
MHSTREAEQWRCTGVFYYGNSDQHSCIGPERLCAPLCFFFNLLYLSNCLFDFDEITNDSWNFMFCRSIENFLKEIEIKK